jgi:pilus assembly protein CpaB
MNKRLVTVFAFALIVAGGASLLLYQMMSVKMSLHPARPTKRIVTAAHVLEIGTLLRAENVRLTDWPGSIPPGAIETVTAAVGRGVVSPIYEGEPLIENRLAPLGAGGGLAATIPAGMRAVAVRVNDLVGVSGFVLPGMHVDVIISGNPPASTGANTGTMSKIILQDIQVLSAGPNFQRDQEGKPITVQVINLLVTPGQAETLSLATNEMRIQLVLRNPLDKDIAKTQGTALANLFNGVTGPPVQPQTAVYRSARVSPSLRPVQAASAGPVLIEVINGTKITELTFAGSGKNVR